MSEADRALWANYAAHVAPLRGRARPDVPPVIAADVTPPAPAKAQAAPPPPMRMQHAPVITVGTAPAGLDARRWAALRRGKLRPERTLDLHGQRAQEAHGAVRAFLAAALADGVRCVCVVTGKGDRVEGGVLRREFPHWLNAPDLRPLVLGAAHPHRAGSGAVHLLLRRPRA
ncbi:Smr/MutS family protein [Plastoroseomonas arctica]|uniref:Smr/MutS family protein n=1 Tax=Plastoroseomonas arctica TaxID=1509237 RepID=UPI001FE97C65|nr:Smr/MutS family protein [Plastoroseomonas arctica]